MIAVLLLVMTGLIDAAQVLLGGKGTLSRLYLAVLGAKLALVAVMLWLAAANRFKWLPKGEEARNRAQHRSVNSPSGSLLCCWRARWVSCSHCFEGIGEETAQRLLALLVLRPQRLEELVAPFGNVAAQQRGIKLAVARLALVPGASPRARAMAPATASGS